MTRVGRRSLRESLFRTSVEGNGLHVVNNLSDEYSQPQGLQNLGGPPQRVGQAQETHSQTVSYHCPARLRCVSLGSGRSPPASSDDPSQEILGHVWGVLANVILQAGIVAKIIKI